MSQGEDVSSRRLSTVSSAGQAKTPTASSGYVESPAPALGLGMLAVVAAGEDPSLQTPEERVNRQRYLEGRKLSLAAEEVDWQTERMQL